MSIQTPQRVFGNSVGEGRGGGGKKENKLLKRTFKLTETSRGVGVGVGGFDQRNPSWGL